MYTFVNGSECAIWCNVDGRNKGGRRYFEFSSRHQKKFEPASSIFVLAVFGMLPFFGAIFECVLCWQFESGVSLLVCVYRANVSCVY